MLHHGSITFQVLRFILLLNNLALKSYDLYVICHLFKINCSGSLLLELNSFNSYACETLIIFVASDLIDSHVLFFIIATRLRIFFFVLGAFNDRLK